MRRRSLLAGAAGLVAGGCSRIGESALFGEAVDAAQGLHKAAHRSLGIARPALAPEYAPEEVSPFFRGNGSVTVDTDPYRASLANGFADWRLTVSGLVARPLSLSMADLRALPQRTQVTRHDCVEGWSAIGGWTGPQLSAILQLAGLLPGARFIVFRCADTLAGAHYYESCDLDDAFHPQTIVAHLLNGEPLPARNGAPLRMRIERQLGYKMAKFLTGIEVVSDFAQIAGGAGGYWEDRGYQWYAGI